MESTQVEVDNLANSESHLASKRQLTFSFAEAGTGGP
jgi:nicotinamide mononucleotide (NMN) deamidase PncC